MSWLSGNYLHDFAATPNEFTHSDFIQMWSTNADIMSRGITVTGNEPLVIELTNAADGYVIADAVRLGGGLGTLARGGRVSRSGTRCSGCLPVARPA